VAGVAVTVGPGSTVISKDCDGPVQPLREGVTVSVAVTVAELELVATNDPMLPVPFAARPIEVLLFVQLRMVPLMEPEKLREVVASLSQTV